jgi:hypothetical protein
MGKRRPQGAQGRPARGEAPTWRVLRDHVRRSPLLSPIERAHWLRVLPHLTAAQRRELAELLAPDADPACG